MSCSIVLRSEERNALLDTYRHHPDPAIGHRAHLILLLADGYSWSVIAAVLFTSASTIARWQRRYQEGGLESLVGQPLGRRPCFALYWAGIVVRWVTACSPRDFGLLRSRWTCATDRKSTRLNSSHLGISYAVFCLKKK